MTLPVYDPANDGNVFDWIVSAAAAHRETLAVLKRQSHRGPTEQQSAYDASIDAEEKARFRALRERAKRIADAENRKS